MFEGFDVSSVLAYGQSMGSNALLGDPAAIILLAGIGILLLAVVFKISSFFFGLIKRFFLFIVVAFSAYFFFVMYNSRLLIEGWTTELLVIGIIGLVGSLAAFIIALVSLTSHAKKQPTSPLHHEAPNFTPTQIQQPQSLTTQALTKDNLISSLKDDRSLLAVLSYVIIAQFGVFSSKTISAPNPEVGMIFFGVFFVGAFLFIKTTYHNYLKGLSHLIIAAVIGAVISIGLGIYWAEIPMETILSIGYFETDAMVAFVTGIAVSLLMGTKN